MAETLIASLTVKNIPDDLYEQFKLAANTHRRSINSGLIVCLEKVLLPIRISAEKRLNSARALRESVNSVLIDASELDEVKNLFTCQAQRNVDRLLVLRQLFNVGCDMNRFDIDQRTYTMVITPIKDITNCTTIGLTGVQVTDMGGKEFNESLGGRFASIEDQGRQDQFNFALRQ